MLQRRVSDEAPPGNRRRFFSDCSKKRIVRGLENERRDDQQKDAAHEVRAPAQGEPGAQQATRNIAHRDERGILPHDVAFTGEHQQGRKIAGHVDHFGAGRGMEKIKPKATDKQENQEIARARPEKSIVKTDQQAAATARARSAPPLRCGAW